MKKENLFKWKHYQPDIILLGVTIHAHQAKVGYSMNFRSCCLHA
ncbi:hypothetical protein BTH41_04409 [Bacillus mycoides]|nr:hypothetical protein BTH41_04409 [Bacillus mycoides]